ncbi:MAG: hypothetical protein PHF79_01290 [Candidatus Pacebacteria bacterium]|nr:hypothetical protein [Candidatus Paceibacterota bacterium]
MRSTVSLIIYIGNGVVKGALVGNSKVPYVIHTESVDIPFQEVADPSRLESLALGALDTVCQNIKIKGFPRLAEKKFSAHISRTSCVFSSPWYISQTCLVKKKSEKPFVVKDSIMDELIKTAEQEIEKNHTNQGLVPIEKRVVSVSLNGYHLSSPLHKTAHQIDLSLFLSFAEKNIVQKVTSTITKHLHPGKLTLHSLSLVAFSTARDIWSSLGHFMLVDVTSELTELTLIKNNAISETVTFPYGKNALVRSLSQDMHVTGEVASSLLRLWQSKSIDPSMQAKVEAAIKKARADWLSFFSKTLTSLSVGTSLPSRFLLIAHDDISPLFSDFVEGEQYNQFSFAEGNFSVTRLTSADVAKYCSFDPEAEQDVVLTFSTLFDQKLS